MNTNWDRNSSVHLQIVLQRAVKIINSKIGKGFKEKGITTSQFSVLDVLYTKGEISDKLELRDITMKIRPFLERIFKIKYPEFYVEGQTWLKNYLDFIKNSNSDKKYQDFQKLYPYLNDLKDILAYTRPFNHDDAKDSFSKLRFKQTKQMVEKTLRLFHVI